MSHRDLGFVENLIARIGLFIAASYGFYMGVLQWGSAADALHPLIVFVGLVTYLVTFWMLFAAATGIGLKSATRFIVIFYLFALVMQAYLHSDGQPLSYGTDSAAFEQAAANYFIQEENPYAQDLLPSLNQFRMPSSLRTPTINGSYQSQLPYPAFSFLLYVPFMLAGIQDARIILLVYHLLLLILLYLAAPRLIKPLVLVPFFATPEVIAYTLGTVTDMPWVFYLTAAALLWKHKNASAVLYGIALSTKQHPWLLLPFLFIRIWKESDGLGAWERLNQIVRYFGIAEIVFLGTNAPFIIQSPSAWLTGVLSPPLGNLIIYGQGLSTLSQVGFLYAPREFYTVSALLIAAALATAYWVYFRQLANVLWLFPGIILWFPYRSLQSYFIYWIPLLLVSLYTVVRNWERGRFRAESVPENTPRLMHLMSIGSLSLAASFVLGGILFFGLFGKPTFQVSVQRALLDPSTNQISQLEITVKNNATDILNPVFWVKQTGRPTYHWDIVRGPGTLNGGTLANYLIEAEFPDYEVPNTESLSVEVNDANDSNTTSYSPAIGVNLTTHASLLNADFFYWTLASSSKVEQPYGWGFYQLGNDSARSGHITQSQVDGRQCVALWTTVTSASSTPAWLGSYLDQWVEFPDYKFRLPVYPTFRSSTDASPSKVFGVEIRDAEHQLWYVFTDSGERVWQDPGNPSLAFHAIDTPINQWSEQTIDIAADYAKLGWSLPAERLVSQDGQTSSKRMINFRIFVGSIGRDPGTLVGCFGPIIQHLH